MGEMEVIPLNKGQQIAKTQELSAGKIALQANEDKQAYASSLVQEDLPITPNQDQDQDQDKR
ncbi:hypothetical protein SAMN03159341_12129 [Paenibacillus sp. 1_12]|nr:hypothetical protein SAMN03159341_12129 [Paenibacillus sp. 1_12]